MTPATTQAGTTYLTTVVEGERSSFLGELLGAEVVVSGGSAVSEMTEGLIEEEVVPSEAVLLVVEIEESEEVLKPSSRVRSSTELTSEMMFV